MILKILIYLCIIFYLINGILMKFMKKFLLNPAKKIGSFFWKKGDIGIIDKFGPDGISKLSQDYF